MPSFLAIFGCQNSTRIARLVEGLGGHPGTKNDAMEALDDIVALTILKRADPTRYSRAAPRDVFFDILDEAVRERHMWVPAMPISVNGWLPDAGGGRRSASASPCGNAG